MTKVALIKIAILLLVAPAAHRMTNGEAHYSADESATAHVRVAEARSSDADEESAPAAGDATSSSAAGPMMQRATVGAPVVLGPGMAMPQVTAGDIMAVGHSIGQEFMQGTTSIVGAMVSAEEWYRSSIQERMETLRTSAEAKATIENAATNRMSVTLTHERKG